MYLQEPQKFCAFSAEAFLKQRELEQPFFPCLKAVIGSWPEQEIHI